MAEVRLTDGVIEYRESGPAAGAPIVFVHGALVDGDLWTDVASELAERGHRTVVPDWPLGAHRRPFDPAADLSPTGVARIVLELLDRLDLDGVTLVANDSGGAITQLLLDLDPDPSRVARVVFTNCDTFERFPPPPFSWQFRLARRPLGLRLQLWPARITVVRQAIFGLLVEHEVEPARTRRWLEPALSDEGIRRDFSRFVGGIDPSELVAAAGRLHRFRGPVLVAWAPSDRFFRIADGRRLAACFGDARVVEIPDSRTFVPLDQPARLAEEVHRFVTEAVVS